MVKILMKIVQVLVASALLCAALAPAQAAPEVIGVDTLLRRETDLAQLPQLRSWTSSLQSSYNRTGSNDDFGQYLATDGTTATIADMAGPGAVVRLWSADPWVQIKIYLDDNPAPVLDTFFGKLFDGSLPPFVAPLAQKSSGGFYSYLPIPYARHCRITVSNTGKDNNLAHLYYQVNFLTFAPSTRVRSFALPLASTDQAALQEATDAWKLSGPILFPGATPRAQDVTVGAGQTQLLNSLSGPGRILRLQLQAPDADDADLRRLIMRGFFDGHQTPDIEAPVSDFFGNAYGRKVFTSLLLSQSSNGTMEARFPMPFGRSARFTLENGTGKPMRIQWSTMLKRQPFDAAREGYFHAQWSQSITRSGLPFVWAKIHGQRGHFVGIVQTMNGPKSLHYLEGDEQFRADASTWGASKVASTVIGPWNGTGTEDIFNSGWYFYPGTNALPLNGLLAKEEGADFSRINSYRWFLNDAPVFEQSLDAQLEHGGVNDEPNLYYSGVAYWYSNGPSQPWSSTPAASSLGPPLRPGLPASQGH